MVSQDRGEARSGPSTTLGASRMNQLMIAGTLSNDWADGAMVVHPFTLGEPVIRKTKQVVRFKILKGKHLLETAMDWQAKIDANPHIQKADIARDVGVTARRVRQIMRLLKLHPDIQAEILNGPKNRAKCPLPESLVRRWTALPPKEQLVQLAHLKHDH